MSGAPLVGCWIDGVEVTDARDTFVSVDPSTGADVAQVAVATAVDVAAAVDAARTAFRGAWGATPPALRGHVLLSVAAAIRERGDALAEVAARDAGVPLALGRADAEVAARYFEFYAGAADKASGESIPLPRDLVDFTVREPWGVCAIITPFNFPLQLFARGVAAALAVGNTVVVKTAEPAPLVGVALAKLTSEAGLPSGTLNVLHGGADVGAALIGHPDVAHVSFTGSVSTGARIMAACSDQVKPLTLELGGKAPLLLLDERYLTDAVATIVGGLFRTCGQACSAPTRLLVPHELHGPALDALTEAASAVRVGPALAHVDMGPLVDERQLSRVLSAIEQAAADGARVVAGGHRLTTGELAHGMFLEPTVLTDVRPEMRIARDEVFGPVLAVLTFDDLDEAIALANDSELGLAAGVWAADVGQALRVAGELRVGQVFVNTYGAGGGVELPFGGYKRSGFGREKGLEALHEYTQVKNVCLKVG